MEDRGYLNLVESDTLVDFLLQMSDRGFPATRNAIYEYTLDLVQVRHPNVQELGANWVDRFITHNADHINMKWSANLESSRAAAVNPAAIEHWFKLLEAQYTKYQFHPKDIYGFDESGFPPTVIFKGKNMRTEWAANNPLKYRECTTVSRLNM